MTGPRALPEDPYRRGEAPPSYRRASHLAALAPRLRIAGLIVVAVAWPLVAGTFVDGVPPLWVAWLAYAAGIALLLTPAIARARIRSTPELAGDGRAPAPDLVDAMEHARGYMLAFATALMLVGATLVPVLSPVG